jgi:NitT/TauT family transport system substrate-binding protein
MARPFREREIDGFFCAEPWGTMAAARGGRILARSGDIAPGHICCVLVARNEFMRHKPHLLLDYVRQLQKAGEYIARHPRESAAIQARSTGADAAAAEEVLSKGHITFSDLVPDQARTRAAMDLALAAGILDRPCDLAAFVCTEFAAHA